MSQHDVPRVCATLAVGFVAAALAPGGALAQAPEDQPPSPRVDARSSTEGDGGVVTRGSAGLRSPSAVAGGVALTVIGAPSAVFGTVVLVGTLGAEGRSGDEARAWGALIGGPTLGGGVLCLAGGISLIVWGAGSDEAPPASAIPTVTVGATSASARWTF